MEDEAALRESLSGSLPEPIEPEESPLWPQHLVDIFLRPRNFFSSQLTLGKTPYILLVTWIYGMAHTIDRIDQNLLRAELGRPRPGWNILSSYILESWIYYWAFLLGFGALSGLIIWYVGGWWFQVRLRWAGAKDADRILARLVYIYSSFVMAGPIVLLALIQSFLFANYREAWNAEESWSMITLIFPFWSCVSSYCGVTTLFSVKKFKTLMWFVILPSIFYVLALGVIATLLLLFRGS